MTIQRPVRLHENSLVARIAACRLKERSIAVTIGRHICLYGISRQNFIQDKNWVCHELAHVDQYLQYGILRFVFLYIKESIKNGYFNNHFEVDARSREGETILLEKYKII